MLAILWEFTEKIKIDMWSPETTLTNGVKLKSQMSRKLKLNQMKKSLFIFRKIVISSIFLLLVISCNNTKKEWKKTQQQNTVEAYQEFVEKHPNTEFMQEAKGKIEKLEWERAISKNTISSYHNFSKKYPESFLLTEAKDSIAKLEFENVIKSDNKDSLLTYLSVHPSSDNTVQIVGMLRNKFTKSKITYSYKSFWMAQVQDQETGAWVNPTYRIYYGDGYTDKTITSHLGEISAKHNLLYQDIATYKRKTNIPMFAYQGCPFSVNNSLSVDKDVSFDKPITIAIESASDNILNVSDESAMPFLYNDGNLLSGYTTATNITWLFLHKGNLFFAGNDGYLIEKDSARIEFTSGGLKLDGVVKFD